MKMIPYEATVSIDSLAFGGAGVGRIGGKVIFVPLTAPGDRAEVRVVADGGSFLRGRLLSLMEGSPLRRDPPCPLFGECGGCHWQHIAYDAQLEAKAAVLSDTLMRVGKLRAPPSPAVVPSPRRYGYRHRCRLHVTPHRGRPVTGFFRSGSRDVVAVDHCPVLEGSLNLLLPLVSSTLERTAAGPGGVRSVILDSDFAGKRASLSFLSAGGSLSIPPDVASRLVKSACRGGVELLLPGSRREGLALGPAAADLRAGGGAFTQVNLEQNRNLVAAVVDLASPHSGERFLDLFCGIGNFSFPLAAAGADILGVERAGAAVRCARDNARRLGADISFRRAEAGAAVRELHRSGERFDAVIVNPPRSGAKDLVASLPELGPSRIVMVSCDPATFSRDAALLSARGYTLAALRPFDLFPQTFHLETAALFTGP